MKSINIILLTILFLGGCASPVIEVSDYTLQIQLDKNRTVKGYGKSIYKSRVNLSNINIYQNVYKMQNGLILTYEDAVVATGYRFSYGVSKMVDIIFPDFNTNIIKSKGNFYFIILKNYNETVYLILENINTKKYKLLYGFNKKIFYELFDTIINDKIIAVNSKLKIQNSAIIVTPQNYIESGWNQRNIILDVILTKVGSKHYY